MTFAVKTLAGFFGLAGVLFFDALRETWKLYLPGILRTFLAACLVVGSLVSSVAFVMLYGPFRIVNRNPSRVFWMRLVAVILWLVVLPFACLWVYDYLHHFR
jgi:hypothetical protein